MDTLTRVRLGLALVAAILFAGSTRRTDGQLLWWVAFGLLVVALLLRFVRKRPPPE